LDIKVSQGSVATRLRWDGIFNNQLVTQSLLSEKIIAGEKNYENRSTFAEVMGKNQVSCSLTHGVNMWDGERESECCVWSLCGHRVCSQSRSGAES